MPRMLKSRLRVNSPPVEMGKKADWRHMLSIIVPSEAKKRNRFVHDKCFKMEKY